MGGKGRLDEALKTKFGSSLGRDVLGGYGVTGDEGFGLSADDICHPFCLCKKPRQYNTQ